MIFSSPPLNASASRPWPPATWLGRSSSPRNEPGDARVHNRIEPDPCTDPLTNFLDRVIGKSRDIKIFLDVVDARSCGERSRDALYGPGQQDLSRGLVDALRNDGDDRIVDQFGFDTVTQRREGLHHDAIAPAIVKQLPFREIWMGFDLNNSRLYARAFEYLFQLAQTDVR